jgi:hypothetical protein
MFPRPSNSQGKFTPVLRQFKHNFIGGASVLASHGGRPQGTDRQ